MKPIFHLASVLLGLMVFARVSAANEIPAVISGADVLSHKPTEIAATGSGKGVVVVFLSARCPCSASHEKLLSALQSEFAPQGFRFVAIHSNSDEDAMMTENHFRSASLPFPVIQDNAAHYADVFGALKTPHVYVLGPDGKVLYQGGVDDSHIADLAKKSYLKDALAAIRDGKEPSVRESRSLGCIIKRP